MVIAECRTVDYSTDMTGTKFCKRHNNGEGAELPLSAFYRAKTGYYFSYCRTCAREALYAWRQENKDRHKAICDKWKKANPETLRESEAKSKAKWFVKNPEKKREFTFRSHLKRAHNVTPEWYAERLLEQKGVCAICGLESKRRLAVDHDHKTEVRRGLLCGQCNTALERMETIENWHEKALRYLAQYEPMPEDIEKLVAASDLPISIGGKLWIGEKRAKIE